MKIADLLSEHREEIISTWLDLIFASYPPETRRFLKSQKDRFANPVAYQVSRGIKEIFAAFLKETDTVTIQKALDEVISVKALQNFSPAQALSFIFLLKNIIRDKLGPVLEDPDLAAACLDLESRIDGLALLGFDVYMQRRERIYDIRVQEMKQRVSGIMRRLGLSWEDEGNQPTG